MGDLHLALTASASLAAAACYAMLALALRRRYGTLEPGLRWPALGFVLWWAMVALQALNDAARFLMGLAAAPDADVYVWLARLKIVAAALAILGLGLYVVYLYHGRRWIAAPIAVVAAAHAGFFLWALQHRLPARIDVGTWAPRLVLEGPSVGGSLGILFLLLFFLPPIVLALAYARLARRIEDRTRRIRVAAIALVVVVYQALATVQFNPSTSADSPAFAVMAAIQLLAAAVAYMAYHPPPALARRWGLQSLRERPVLAT